MPAIWKMGDSCLKANLHEKRGGLMSQNPSSWEDGGLVFLSPSFYFSAGRGFYEEGEGNGAKRPRERVEKFSTCRQVQCIPVKQGMACCASSWFSLPGFTSSWLYGWKSANLLELGCLKSEPVSFEQLVPRIMTQSCCVSVSYTLGRVSIYRNNVKRMVGWVTILHGYNAYLSLSQLSYKPFEVGYCVVFLWVSIASCIIFYSP